MSLPGKTAAVTSIISCCCFFPAIALSGRQQDWLAAGLHHSGSPDKPIGGLEDKIKGFFKRKGELVKMANLNWIQPSMLRNITERICYKIEV